MVELTEKGEKLSDPMGLIERFGLTVIDEKEAEDFERQEQLKEEKERRSRLYGHYASPASGVPERYWNESLDSYNPRDKESAEALAKVRRFVDSKGCRMLMLCGANGTGKTHLGCGIIRERGGIYVPMLRLMYEVDGAMSFKAKESKIQLLDRLCETPMLVLDELARVKVREDMQVELAVYILSERYAKGKPTVIISNLWKDDLVKWLGMAVKDRLNECGEVVEFHGQSYRIAKRAEVFNGGNKC